MPDEIVAYCDFNPWYLRFWCTGAFATESVLLLALHFIELDYVDQPTMSGRRFEAYCKFWIFMVEPLGDGLERVALTKSADDLSVVTITPNCL